MTKHLKPIVSDKAHDLAARRAEVLEVATFIYAARTQGTASGHAGGDFDEVVHEAVNLISAVERLV